MLLRPWTLDDAPAVVQAFASPGMERQGGPVTSIEEARQWLEPMLWGRTDGLHAFAVDVDGEAAGQVMLSAVEYRHGTAWVSYWTAAAFQRRGIATRALASLAQWAFDDGGLFRLELGHRVNNPASASVARRAGFIQEGLEQAKLQYDGKRYDVAVYARLATDPAPAVDLLPVREFQAR